MLQSCLSSSLDFMLAIASHNNDCGPAEVISGLVGDSRSTLIISSLHSVSNNFNNSESDTSCYHELGYLFFFTEALPSLGNSANGGLMQYVFFRIHTLVRCTFAATWCRHVYTYGSLTSRRKRALHITGSTFQNKPQDF